MRLLAKQDIKIDQLKKDELALRRTILLQRRAEDDLKRINSLAGQVDGVKRKKVEEFDRFTAGIEERKRKLYAEVRDLEERTRLGMAPLEEYHRQLLVREDEVVAQEQEAIKRSARLKEWNESLVVKQEQTERKISELVVKAERLAQLERMTTVGYEQYKAEREAWEEHRQAKDKEMAKVSADLEKRAKLARSDELANKAIKEAHAKEKLKIEAAWARIRDERATLERAKKEIYGRR